MPMLETIIRVSYDGGSCNLTKRYPSLRIAAWCNQERDVIELFIRDQEDYTRFIKEVARPMGLIDSFSAQQGYYMIIRKCACMQEKASVVKLIRDFDVLHISPSMAEKGWEYHRLVMFKQKEFLKAIQRLEKAGFEIEIMRKIPFGGSISGPLTLSADALFSKLTDKQIDALLTAHRAGYYGFPRKTNVQTIAALKHVPRTTFGDNLKKAESKLVTSLVPYIHLFRHAPKEKL